MPKPFTNPYLDVPHELQFKTTIFFDGKDVSDLKTMHPSKGVLQSTVALLTVKLIEQLRKHELVRYNPKGFEQLVATATISLDPDTVAKYFSVGIGGTATQSGVGQSAKAGGGDERRRTASVPRGKKKHATEPSDTGSGGPSKEKLNKYK